QNGAVKAIEVEPTRTRIEPARTRDTRGSKRQDLAKPMLTEKQKELLVFINARLQATGIPPSFDEMKEALELQSKSGVRRLIIALEERGFIRRLPHRARAIEIIKLPDAMAE